MGKTLNLIDGLLTKARNYQQLHRDREALRTFVELLRLGGLPAKAAEQARVGAAELLLRHGKPGRARHHLTEALGICPNNARYHCLMATAIAKENTAPELAATHYRKSLELEPEQPECLGQYGLLLVRAGKAAAGLKLLRQAAEMAPDDAAVIGRLIRGLRRTRRLAEARQVLTAARFRNPRDAGFRRLYNDLMFHELLRTQKKQRQVPAAPELDRSALLPLVRLLQESERGNSQKKLIRIDEAAPTPGPHTTARPARRPDWKHG